MTSARPESREAFASKHAIRAFASVSEMLPHIDLLAICTPPSSHAPYIFEAAAAGKHVRRQFFRARLPGTAGDADDRPAPILSNRAG